MASDGLRGGAESVRGVSGAGLTDHQWQEPKPGKWESNVHIRFRCAATLKRLTISGAKMSSKDVRGTLRFPSWPKPGAVIHERGSQISACLQVAGHNEKCSACCANVTLYRLAGFCSQRGEGARHWLSWKSPEPKPIGFKMAQIVQCGCPHNWRHAGDRPSGIIWAVKRVVLSLTCVKEPDKFPAFLLCRGLFARHHH